MLRQGSGPPGPEDSSSSESHPVPSRPIQKGGACARWTAWGWGGRGRDVQEGVETGRILPGQCVRPCDRKTPNAAHPLQPPKTPLDTEAEHSQTCWVQTESATAAAKRLPGLRAGGAGVGGLLSNGGGRGGEGRRQGQGGWGPTPPTESRAPIPCQEHARTIGRDLGRGRLAAKLNLGELGF